MNMTNSLWFVLPSFLTGLSFRPTAAAAKPKATKISLREGEEGLAGKEGRVSFLKNSTKVGLSSLIDYMLMRRGMSNCA